MAFLRNPRGNGFLYSNSSIHILSRYHYLGNKRESFHFLFLLIGSRQSGFFFSLFNPNIDANHYQPYRHYDTANSKKFPDSVVGTTFIAHSLKIIVTDYIHDIWLVCCPFVRNTRNPKSKISWHFPLLLWLYWNQNQIHGSLKWPYRSSLFRLNEENRTATTDREKAHDYPFFGCVHIEHGCWLYFLQNGTQDDIFYSRASIVLEVARSKNIFDCHHSLANQDQFNWKCIHSHCCLAVANIFSCYFLLPHETIAPKTSFLFLKPMIILQLDRWP